MKMVITNAGFSSFVVKLKYMSTYKRTTVWHHWNDLM